MFIQFLRWKLSDFALQKYSFFSVVNNVVHGTLYLGAQKKTKKTQIHPSNFTYYCLKVRCNHVAFTKQKIKLEIFGASWSLPLLFTFQFVWLRFCSVTNYVHCSKDWIAQLRQLFILYWDRALRSWDFTIFWRVLVWFSFGGGVFVFVVRCTN